MQRDKGIKGYAQEKITAKEYVSFRDRCFFKILTSYPFCECFAREVSLRRDTYAQEKITTSIFSGYVSYPFFRDTCPFFVPTSKGYLSLSCKGRGTTCILLRKPKDTACFVPTSLIFFSKEKKSRDPSQNKGYKGYQVVSLPLHVSLYPFIPLSLGYKIFPYPFCCWKKASIPSKGDVSRKKGYLTYPEKRDTINIPKKGILNVSRKKVYLTYSFLERNMVFFRRKSSFTRVRKKILFEGTLSKRRHTYFLRKEKIPCPF